MTGKFWQPKINLSEFRRTDGRSSTMGFPAARAELEAASAALAAEIDTQLAAHEQALKEAN